jgi:2-keto-myo-inositol isomerase
MARVNRRAVLASAGTAIAAALIQSTRAGEQRSLQGDSQVDNSPQQRFGYCFNTSTIRGQELTLPQQIEVAASAGYEGIEPWIREIRRYLEAGGTATDLRKQIADSGLTVESGIGFANWIVDDAQQRADGLETAKSDMDLIRQIGGSRIAAPPAGATNQEGLNLFHAADRYRALLELGERMQVVPQLELWGFSKSLSRLGELLFVASESGHPNACMLPDVYHIYKGGSAFDGLRLINGAAMHVFHMNDYPAAPPRESIGDEDRVYPGDGVAPLSSILQTLSAVGFRGMLSLELFNRDYWKRDALEVAKTGLAKMRAAVETALGR